MTDIASARDDRLPIAQPASRNDCETADVIGLRAARDPEGRALPRTRPRWASERGRSGGNGRYRHTQRSLIATRSSLRRPWACGRRGPRRDLWADPLEICSEWYSSTAPIAANYLTSRRPATTYNQSEHGGDRFELPLRRF